VRFYTKIGRFAFLRPLLGDLGATYDDHLRLIGGRVVDFLLVLIELISLDVMPEELRIRTLNMLIIASSRHRFSPLLAY